MQQQSRKRNYLSFTLATTSAVAVAFAVISACSGQQAKAKPNFVYKDAPKNGVVAKIGGEEITEDALIGDEKLEFLDIKKREYELKMNQLNKLMIERLIGAEAKAANMSLDDFINKKVLSGEIKISDSDYKKFVAEKHIPESQLNPQVKERITQYLQQMKKQEIVQNHIAKLTKRTPVEVYFNKPKMQIAVDAGDSVWFGGKDAKVTIVEFSDFECPFCSRAAETVNQVKKKYGNKIKVAFKHFPLPMHKEARPAHEASLCINEQSMDKFWKFHDMLFKAQDKLDTANLEKYAKDVGADMTKYKECVDSKKFAAIVQRDMDYGERLGVRSTPTFFVNGQLLAGALPLDAFSEVIDEELANAKK